MSWCLLASAFQPWLPEQVAVPVAVVHVVVESPFHAAMLVLRDHKM